MLLGAMSCVCNHSNRPFPASTPRDAPARCRLRSRAQRCLRATRGCAPPTRVVHIFCWQACGHPEAIQLKPLIYQRFFGVSRKRQGRATRRRPPVVHSFYWQACGFPAHAHRKALIRHGLPRRVRETGSPAAGCPFQRHLPDAAAKGAGGPAGRLPACGSASPGREPASAIGSDYRSG